MFVATKQDNMEKTKNRERFERVASNRVQRIIDTISLLGNCSNRSNYEYTKDDVELMFREIGKAVRDVRNIFQNELDKSNKTGFRF